MEEKRIRELEEYIKEIMQEAQARGIAVSVIDEEGNSLYRQFFGERDAEKHLAVNEDTIFGLASVTKSFTAAAIMQLVEEGKIDLEDPVSKYIPDYKDPENHGIVRIHHLLSHSGGFFPQYRRTVEKELPATGIEVSLENELIYNDDFARFGVQMVAGNLSGQTSFTGEPGEQMSYSNDGYGLLSDIIRTQSDCDSFARYLEKHILEPLGMNRSTCSFLKPAMDENSAVLYTEEEDGWRKDHDYYHVAYVLNGGGAMKSTLKDMEKYVGMYLHHGSTILSPASISKMETPDVLEKPGVWYCFGLENRMIPGTDYTVIQHGGSLPGVSSNIAWSHEAGIGVIVLCNTQSVPVSLISDAVLRTFMNLEMIPEKPVHPTCTWTDAYLQEIKGKYEGDEGDAFEIRTEDSKVFIVRNAVEDEVHPAWKNTGIVSKKRSDQYVQFLSDKEGHVYAARCGTRILPKR